MKKYHKVETVRDLANLYPRMWKWDYSWTDSDKYRKLSDVLADYGYKLSKEDREYEGEYNDIKGYLNCKVVALSH
jgi:hypothetical protein